MFDGSQLSGAQPLRLLCVMLEQELGAEGPTNSDVSIEIFNPGVDHVKVSQEKIVRQTK